MLPPALAPDPVDPDAPPGLGFSTFPIAPVLSFADGDPMSPPQLAITADKRRQRAARLLEASFVDLAEIIPIGRRDRPMASRRTAAF
jgi:hypothetical protein